MEFDNFLSLFAGLALFLYGMHMMSHGLELAAGNKMQRILEKLTSNRFIGVLVGAGITALIQSSSATTVMVVGFVNTGLMTLNQAVWVIMGANIGTTITGQLIALDVGRVAPLLALVGVVMVVFLKNKKINCWGEILAGLGVLFIGMGMMSSAMTPLRNDPTFINLMTNFNNPVIAILVGAAFTAVIQSSSASVGILQTLATSGLIGLGQSAYILFGQNIGTCITAFLASLGSNRNAKRTTVIHLSFNIIGTIIFIAACSFLPIITWVENMTPTSPASQIANLHTVFNIVTTLLLLPFGTYLSKLSMIILPVKDNEKLNIKKIDFLPDTVGSTFAAISGIKAETKRMFEMVGNNINRALDLLIDFDEVTYRELEEQEDYINYLSEQITLYVGKATSANMQISDSELVNAVFKMATMLERVGNHATNIARAAQELNEKGVEFNQEDDEIHELKLLLSQCISYIENSELFLSEEGFQYIKDAENKIDDLTTTYRNNQMKRLKNKDCSVESCVIYSRVLIDAERISDYLSDTASLCKDHKVSFVSQ